MTESSPQGQDQVSASLLPCPFCGGVAEINQIGNEYTKSQGFEVKCLTWGCATKKRAKVIRQPLEVARRYIIAAWNRRTPPPAVSEVREAVARIVDPRVWARIDKVMSGDLDGIIPEGWSREQYATSCYYEERRDSFAKADLILALPLPRMERPLTSEEATMLDRAHMRGVKVVGEIAPANPFIQWNGGENPAPDETVEYRLRDGYMGKFGSDCLMWEHQGRSYDIIAYRIIPTDTGKDPA